MEQNNVISEFDTLPLEAQRQVLDFIAFLQARYQPATGKRTKTKARIANEQFVGMWRNRAEMCESSGWVRGLRTTEWGNSA